MTSPWRKRPSPTRSPGARTSSCAVDEVRDRTLRGDVGGLLSADDAVESEVEPESGLETEDEYWRAVGTGGGGRVGG